MQERSRSIRWKSATSVQDRNVVKDRIEAHALGMVFSAGAGIWAPDDRTSEKGFIGHLEGARLASPDLIKAVMVERGSLLPSGGTRSGISYPIHGSGPEFVDGLPGVAGGGGSAAPGWGVSSFGFGRHQCA